MHIMSNMEAITLFIQIWIVGTLFAAAVYGIAIWIMNKWEKHTGKRIENCFPMGYEKDWLD